MAIYCCTTTVVVRVGPTSSIGGHEPVREVHRSTLLPILLPRGTLISRRYGPTQVIALHTDSWYQVYNKLPAGPVKAPARGPTRSYLHSSGFPPERPAKTGTLKPQYLVVYIYIYKCPTFGFLPQARGCKSDR